ncbi:MAG: energy-coupling factor ABC transporter permease [Candidatus Baldrarchaeia archaeon]
MAHIHSEAVLPMTWCLIWWGAALLMLGVSLFKTRNENPRRIVRTAILAAFAFGVMQINVPVAWGIHLDFMPLIGILSGPYLGFLAAFVVNLFCIMIGHGGVMVAGANTILLGVFEAMLAYWLFTSLRRVIPRVLVRGAVATFVSLVISAFAMVGMLALGAALSPATYLILLIAFVGAAVVESLITAVILHYLSQMGSELVEVK